MSENENAAAAASRETIIVVEDSPPNRKILAHLLEKLGFHVIACEHGQQAWDQIKDGKIQNLAAVVSDIMMPTMDGLNLLKLIRENPDSAKLPVLLITAMSDKEYIVRARELNVDGYILKPVTFERVSSKLREIFPHKEFPRIAG